MGVVSQNFKALSFLQKELICLLYPFQVVYQIHNIIQAMWCALRD
jgi:hypothetical protein